MFDQWRLDSDVAWVTGASRGIGAAIADVLAEAGARVIGTATTEAGARGISDRLAASGGRGIVLDVTDRSAVSAAAAGIAGQDGPVTVLVNNAGITRDNLLLRMKDEEWDQVLAANLTAVSATSRACLRGMMKARRGRIINVGSVVGLMGNPGQSNFCAAISGLVGFTRSLAREVGSRGITVNTVAPGFIDTDMTRSLGDEQRQALESGIPLARLGDVRDVAAAVAFLASPAGGYITGEVLNVNGGMYMG